MTLCGTRCCLITAVLVVVIAWILSIYSWPYVVRRGKPVPPVSYGQPCNHCPCNYVFNYLFILSHIILFCLICLFCLSVYSIVLYCLFEMQCMDKPAQIDCPTTCPLAVQAILCLRLLHIVRQRHLPVLRSRVITGETNSFKST